MKLIYLVLFILTLFSCAEKTATENSEKSTPVEWAIIIHGGAGNFYNGDIAADKKAAYDKSMAAALAIGSQLLADGETSLKAVEQTIRFMEDDSIFNAGRGAVLTGTGTAELDASIMQGKDLDAGAVAGVSNTKHPISAAIQVMQNSPHVMLSGSGADQFAKDRNLELVDNDYFITATRKAQYESEAEKRSNPEKMGTVGCVAIDKEGNIVAGTSTGGTFYKQWGRIGDSPIIGAGTYASNKSCGVSATGTGEFFIRGTVARDIAALMEMKNMTLQEAADQVVKKQLPAIDQDQAKGGIIALDKDGNMVYSFNTFGMLHAYKDSAGDEKLGLYQ